ncbi:MAG: hypothetical protein ABSC37_18220 [Xanthobacteraceae bacterium]|jgi:hypothetical protein
MKYSSAQQLTFELDDTNSSSAGGIAAPSAIPASASSAPVQFPEFGDYGSAFAESARIAGRINAGNISEAEHDALLRERQSLLDKKFDGNISRKDANRLEYVRWSLDRIEDAKNGLALELLESYVKQYEQFQSDLHLLVGQLNEKLPRRKRK